MTDRTVSWRAMHIDSQPAPHNVQLVIELDDGDVIRLNLSEQQAENAGAALCRASGMIAKCPRSIIENT